MKQEAENLIVSGAEKKKLFKGDTNREVLNKIRFPEQDVFWISPNNLRIGYLVRPLQCVFTDFTDHVELGRMTGQLCKRVREHNPT